MEVRATAKYLRVQPRKVRIIADELRGRPAVHSSALLQYHPSKSARLLRKVLESAMANAKENHQINAEDLRIATIWVDEGPVLKRMRARAMGRGFRIEKKTAHITVVVEEDFENAGASRAKQKSKAKPRPTFGAPKKAAGATAGKKKKGAEAPVEEMLQPEEEVVETTAAAEEPVAAAEETEATPVTASEAPEEEGGAGEEVDKETSAEAEGAN
ncbi:MAG TPA: 50S ribosomal protein L22 [Fimbriimonadaceae bacterium]|jgi:large subunit ribosomal protein L22